MGHTNGGNSLLSTLTWRDLKLPLTGFKPTCPRPQALFEDLLSVYPPAPVEYYSISNYAVKLASSVLNP